MIFEKLRDDAIIPQRQTKGASGFDLHTIEDVEVPAGGFVVVPTGIKVNIPEWHEGQIRSRSGLATKGVFVLNAPGTVDSDYQGEVKVILANMAKVARAFRRGDRIAQLVLASSVIMFDETEPERERGDKGFGSTGV